MKLEHKIIAAENRVRAAKSELHYLREELADADGWPRIAKGKGFALGELHLVLGVYGGRFVTRRIRDNGALSPQASGYAVTDGHDDEPSYLTPKEARIKAARHNRRRWAKKFLEGEKP